MPHSYGLRAKTRDLFQREFRKHGAVIPLKTYLLNYKVGQFVDIKANAAIQRGMPHKGYHGKTGVIYNVSKRALGVEVNKLVGNRIMKKRINIRVEHVQPSKCRDDFLKRIAANDKAKQQARKDGKTISTKRPAVLPRLGHSVRSKKYDIVTVQPEPYAILL